MENRQLIVTTIYALAGGMHKSWVPAEFIALVGGEIHHAHRAARYALKNMAKLDTLNGWSEAHVAMLLELFMEKMGV